MSTIISTAIALDNGEVIFVELEGVNGASLLMAKHLIEQAGWMYRTLSNILATLTAQHPNGQTFSDAFSIDGRVAERIGRIPEEMFEDCPQDEMDSDAAPGPLG